MDTLADADGGVGSSGFEIKYYEILCENISVVGLLS